MSSTNRPTSSERRAKRLGACIALRSVIFPIWGNRREGDHPQSHTVGAELNINSIDKVFRSAIAIITYRNTTIAIYVISLNVRILQDHREVFHKIASAAPGGGGGT